MHRVLIYMVVMYFPLSIFSPAGQSSLSLVLALSVHYASFVSGEKEQEGRLSFLCSHR